MLALQIASSTPEGWIGLAFLNRPQIHVPILYPVTEEEAIRVKEEGEVAGETFGSELEVSPEAVEFVQLPVVLLRSVVVDSSLRRPWLEFLVAILLAYGRPVLLVAISDSRGSYRVCVEIPLQLPKPVEHLVDPLQRRTHQLLLRLRLLY